MPKALEVLVTDTVRPDCRADRLRAAADRLDELVQYAGDNPGMASWAAQNAATAAVLRAVAAIGAAPAPAAAPAPVAAAAPAAPRADQPREERVKMTRLRQTIARRLKESQNTAAQLTTFNEVDMTNVMALRAQY